MPTHRLPTDPEQLAEYLRAERAPIRRTGTRPPISLYIRRLVYRRDEYMCQRCSRTPFGQVENRRTDEGLHLDHIRPWSSFEPGDLGADRTDNLRTLCGPCNRERSNFVSVGDVPTTPIVRICLWCLVAIDERYASWLERPDHFEVYCAKTHHIGTAIPGWSIL